jgi:hypothetical protein
MKKLLITLMLISPFSFAGWGDVYYCQMTTLSNTTLEGERTDYKLEKFTFKLDKTKKAMVFGQNGYFEGKEMELRGLPSKEIWYASDEFSLLSFSKGKSLYVFTTVLTGSNSISADCEKF